MTKINRRCNKKGFEVSCLGFDLCWNWQVVQHGAEARFVKCNMCLQFAAKTRLLCFVLRLWSIRTLVDLLPWIPLHVCSQDWRVNWNSSVLDSLQALHCVSSLAQGGELDEAAVHFSISVENEGACLVIPVTKDLIRNECSEATSILRLHRLHRRHQYLQWGSELKMGWQPLLGISHFRFVDFVKLFRGECCRRECTWT